MNTVGDGAFGGMMETNNINANDGDFSHSFITFKQMSTKHVTDGISLSTHHPKARIS